MPQPQPDRLLAWRVFRIGAWWGMVQAYLLLAVLRWAGLADGVAIHDGAALQAVTIAAALFTVMDLVAARIIGRL